MAGSSLSAGSFGASWAGGSGFWWTGWGAQCWGKSSKPGPFPVWWTHGLDARI